MKDAEEDELWKCVVEKAESFIENNEELKISYPAAFEKGMKKYKCVIMQYIKDIMEENVNIQDEEEAEAEDLGQIGAGYSRNFTKRY